MIGKQLVGEILLPVIVREIVQVFKEGTFRTF